MAYDNYRNCFDQLEAFSTEEYQSEEEFDKITCFLESQTETWHLEEANALHDQLSRGKDYSKWLRYIQFALHHNYKTTSNSWCIELRKLLFWMNHQKSEHQKHNTMNIFRGQLKQLSDIYDEIICKAFMQFLSTENKSDRARELNLILNMRKHKAHHLVAAFYPRLCI